MDDNDYNKIKLLVFGYLFSCISMLIKGIIFNLCCLAIFIFVYGKTEKIIVIPFAICGIAILIRGIYMTCQSVKISKYFKQGNGHVDEQMICTIDKNIDKANNISNIIYSSGFFLIWFGFLFFMDYYAIKTWNSGGIAIFFISILFWIVGIFSVKKKLNKFKEISKKHL